MADAHLSLNFFSLSLTLCCCKNRTNLFLASLSQSETFPTFFVERKHVTVLNLRFSIFFFSCANFCSPFFCFILASSFKPSSLSCSSGNVNDDDTHVYFFTFSHSCLERMWDQIVELQQTTAILNSRGWKYSNCCSKLCILFFIILFVYPVYRTRRKEAGRRPPRLTVLATESPSARSTDGEHSN